jgi:hypothetical protein
MPAANRAKRSARFTNPSVAGAAVFRGDDGVLKYEFRVEPGAAPLAIQLAYRGAEGLSVGDSDALKVETGSVVGDTTSKEFPSGDQPSPDRGFDQSNNGGGDVFVAKLAPDGETLEYWTFLGGSELESGGEIAVEGAGPAYVTSSTRSGDFPSADKAASGDGFDQSSDGGAFVAKLAPDGTDLEYWSFLAGGRTTVALDDEGSAYVAASRTRPRSRARIIPAPLPGSTRATTAAKSTTTRLPSSSAEPRPSHD